MDKVFLYLIYPYDKVREIHRKNNKHHIECVNGFDLEQLVIDCECARFTKPDKPLNAICTIEKYYSNILKNDRSRAELHCIIVDKFKLMTEKEWCDSFYNYYKK